MTSTPLFSRPPVAVVFIVIAVALDQWIKYLIVLHLPLHVEYHVIWYFYLNHTTNTGVAFSFLSGMSGWVIDIMRLAIVAFILWWWRTSRQAHGLVHFGFCMVIAGAIGNIIDRFIYGHVVDYVLFHTQTWSFAVFNLADSLITVGAVLIGFCELFLNRKQPDKAG
ncbi:signal peptidase II [Rhizobium sp. LjRoot254]|uniref:signal peptidase II n=1 Tax=Rhizobium sp. LjRoot254 TaxID=3342297 RepID=UPI003ECE1A05